MASLTTSDVRAYVSPRQEKGYANATINRELAARKRMFTLAIQAGKLQHRPYIPMLAEDNIRQDFSSARNSRPSGTTYRRSIKRS
jgi:site-specific recombinase XerD